MMQRTTSAFTAAVNDTKPLNTSEPSRRLFLVVIALFSIVTVAYLSAGVLLHLRQGQQEQFVTHLQPDTSRDAVRRQLGSPDYAARNGSEWLYYPSHSAFELPITPVYPALYARFSADGTVSAAGIAAD